MRVSRVRMAAHVRKMFPVSRTHARVCPATPVNTAKHRDLASNTIVIPRISTIAISLGIIVFFVAQTRPPVPTHFSVACFVVCLSHLFTQFDLT